MLYLSNMVEHKKRHLNKGFTIVELLIVVVVIAVLAAITIVAYTGIQNRAKASAAETAASQVSKKLKVYFIENAEVYPAAAGQAGIDNLAPLGFTNSTNTTYEYSANNSINPKTFCVTVTANSVSYYSSQDTAEPQLGGCPGHSANGVATITNLVTNPSVESNNTGWGAPNSAVLLRQAGSALHGAQGMRYTAPANNLDSGAQIPVGSSLTAGQSYTASVTVRAVTAGNYSLSVQGTAGAPGRDTRMLTAGQTARFVFTWTPSSTGSIAFYVLRQGGQAGAHDFDVDGAMLLQNSTNSVFADGSTSGWIWNGATNNSTSTGLPQ
jgi:prepilin-type N-terminal cleavage/methylation domain-containing protein